MNGNEGSGRKDVTGAPPVRCLLGLLEKTPRRWGQEVDRLERLRAFLTTENRGREEAGANFSTLMEVLSPEGNDSYTSVSKSIPQVIDQVDSHK